MIPKSAAHEEYCGEFSRKKYPKGKRKILTKVGKGIPCGIMISKCEHILFLKNPEYLDIVGKCIPQRDS